MKILHLHDEPEVRGGAEVYIRQVGKLMQEDGYTSGLCTITRDTGGWTVRFAETERRLRSISDATSYVAEIASEFDLLCVHNLFEGAFVDKLLEQKPVIKFSHSPVVVCPGRDKYWRYSGTACTRPYGYHCLWHAYSEGCTNRHPKRLLKAFHFTGSEIHRAKKEYARTIVMSEFNRQKLLECGIPTGKIVVNPYFTEYVEDPSRKVDSLSNLLFMGRLVAGKGLPELLKATIPILQGNHVARLHIVGDGPLMNELQHEVNTKGISHQVVFWGWQSREEVAAHLRASKVVVFPSTYPESFGIVGIEAMMYGKPVVGFDVGGVSTWLKNEETGFLVAPGDAKAMEIAISKLLNNDNLYEVFSRNARKEAVSRFLPAHHLQRLSQTFEDVLGETATTSMNRNH